ncbi:MAG: hypothetical protein IM477_16665 [Microcystis sp. M090S1]|nr:hypothetical protein [Microcystis sp. M090S1]MCA2814071.1 hypothetical protein [Microcystis sp. M090S1]
MPIVFNLERANQLSLLPDKDLADFCPLIEPHQVTKNPVVEAILLIKEAAEMDETDYLLSTEANRQHLQEARESLKNPDSYIYVDAAN